MQIVKWRWHTKHFFFFFTVNPERQILNVDSVVDDGNNILVHYWKEEHDILVVLLIRQTQHTDTLNGIKTDTTYWYS